MNYLIQTAQIKLKIDYLSYVEFPGWGEMPFLIKDIIIKRGIKKVLEIGAGANPTLDSSQVRELDLSYTISDVDEDELIKADDIYKKLVLDLSSSIISHKDKYDLIFSRMTGEHIKDGMTFHKNVFRLLTENGIALHCYSTLYAFPFILNYLLPEKIADLFLKSFAPRDKYKHGKFKAYYSWCRGPTNKMFKRFEELGYKVEEYFGFFGHNYYHKIPVVRYIESFKTTLLLKFPIPLLTSYAKIVLRRLEK